MNRWVKVLILCVLASVCFNADARYYTTKTRKYYSPAKARKILKKDLAQLKNELAKAEKTGDKELVAAYQDAIKAKMKEEDALLAGEMSGHIFFKDEYYGFDDAIYVSARLVQMVSRNDKPLSDYLDTGLFLDHRLDQWIDWRTHESRLWVGFHNCRLRGRLDSRGILAKCSQHRHRLLLRGDHFADHRNTGRLCVVTLDPKLHVLAADHGVDFPRHAADYTGCGLSVTVL